MTDRAANPRAETAGADMRAEELLRRLTLEEKIRLLAGLGGSRTAPIPEKGIPSFQFSDGPCGLHAARVSLPATVALAAAWDRDLARRFGEGIGRAGRALGMHFHGGPALNMYRSPLCGRNFEYMGEDPYLAAETAVAYVQGLQAHGVSATPKHFALNFQEYDRYFVSSDVDERTLREIYLPAFEAAVVRGGAGAVMSAYNPVNGAWCSQNRHLLTEILKAEWGFRGFVVSDWVSTHDGVAAANAGLDLEMPTGAHMNAATLLPAVRDGRVSEAAVDDKIRRLFRTAFRFGWFERAPAGAAEPAGPAADAGAAIHVEGSTPPEERARRYQATPEGRELIATALDAARAGCVLLKNEGGILPFDPARVRTIAVLGPNAHPAVTGGGGSSYVKPLAAVSILDGLRALAPAGVEVRFAKGCDVGRQDLAFAGSVFRAPGGEPGLRAEYFNNLDLAGEPALTTVENPINLLWMTRPPAPGIDKHRHSIRLTGTLCPERTGEHVFYFSGGDGEYRVRVGGETLFDRWGKGHSGPRRAYRALEAGRTCDVLIEYRPVMAYNWIQFGWEHADAVWPDRGEALRLARACDAVVYCGGHSRFSEGENFDRTFAMPPEAEDLLVDVARANPRTVVVTTAGGGIDARRWIDGARGWLHAWYPGQQGGTAIAEILFGAVNPSGKLPVTFERRPEDRSSFGCYHDEDGDRRVKLTDGVFTGYRHADARGIEPLFPFGFGLSYTSFAYENLAVDGATREVALDIINTGARAGGEVAQVYVGDPAAPLPRPPKELKGFAKVFLQAGERRRVTVQLDGRALQCFDPGRGWVAGPGPFEVMVGASSRDIRLRGMWPPAKPGTVSDTQERRT